jgi:diguanylate cyclase (GGDEF)-like protein
MFKKRPMSLTGKFSFMTGLFLSMIIGVFVIFTTYFIYGHISNMTYTTHTIDRISCQNITRYISADFEKMRHLAMMASVSPARSNTLLGEYFQQTGTDVALLSPFGEVMFSTENIHDKEIDIMTVSAKRDFTIKSPFLFSSYHDTAKIRVPVFTPLQDKKGFLYFLWEPRILPSKSVPWISNVIYAPDGSLVTSNFSLSHDTMPLPSKTSVVLRPGTITTPLGKGFCTSVTLPDRDVYWWVLTIAETQGMLVESLKKIIPLLIIIPMLLLLIFLPFRKLRVEVTEDLLFIRDLIRDYYHMGKVDVHIFKKSHSYEARQLGKMFLDMSEQINFNMSSLKNQADRDALTGLPNRMAMERELESRIAKEEMFAILFLDLDGFKPINDMLGHEVGDMTLQSVAKKLVLTFRDKDFVCRWGGDEFVVCLHGNVEVVVPKLINRIRGKLSEINTNAMAGRDDLPPYKVGASFPEDGSSVESLIHKADERMYQDKMTRKAGR